MNAEPRGTDRHDAVGSTSALVRVLAAIDSLEVGGAQYQLLTVCANLPRSSYRFAVATSGQEPLISSFRRGGAQVHTLVQRSIKHRISPTFTARLIRLARSGSFDLIHGHLHSASVACAVAARVTGLPLVLTHHSMNTWRPPWQRALGDWADRQAGVVIAVATNVASTISSPRVEIVPNGVHTKPEAWSPEEVAAARRKLGVPTDAYLLSYVGRLTTDKNPLRFVEIAGRVAPGCPEAHFVLMGDGPLQAAAAARARALGIEQRVTFAGFVPGAGRLHHVADVLMLTSDSEGSPLAVLDAMAAGRPVIATAVGDVPEQVVDGETGYVCPPNDLDGLANAVLTLRDPAVRARLGTAGRKRAHELFSIDRMLERTAAAYREALAGRKRRR